MGDICHSQMHATRSPSDDGFDQFDYFELLKPVLTRIQIVNNATNQVVSDMWSDFDWNLFFAMKADTWFSSVLKYKDDLDMHETIILNVDGPSFPSYFYLVEELLKSAKSFTTNEAKQGQEWGRFIIIESSDWEDFHMWNREVKNIVRGLFWNAPPPTFGDSYIKRMKADLLTRPWVHCRNPDFNDPDPNWVESQTHGLAVMAYTAWKTA